MVKNGVLMSVKDKWGKQGNVRCTKTFKYRSEEKEKNCHCKWHAVLCSINWVKSYYILAIKLSMIFWYDSNKQAAYP